VPLNEAERAYAREYQARWRAEHPERALANRQRWAAEHPNYERQWRADHPLSEAARARKRETTRRWRKQYPEKAAKNWRQFKETWNPPDLKQRQRGYATKWRTLHLQAAHEAQQRYVQAHPEKIREKRLRRVARERGTASESINPQAIYDRDGGRCHICGKKVPRRKASLDHLIPRAFNGPHLAINVRIVHRSCNFKRRHLGPAQLLLL